MMQFKLIAIRLADINLMLDWRYQPPFDFYNPPQENLYHLRTQLLDPFWRFHAVLDEQGALSGYCSFGEDGQVAGGDYTLNALDIGLGLRPDLTGKGYGACFLTEIMDHARDIFEFDTFRLTVAAFNHRAISLYGRLGFEIASTFTDTAQVDYLILTKLKQSPA
ncbi:MAG: GNAT family N-acetyltransferase [Gammaproteobacteria bacterium]|jgi:[ribosomal protein S18]-alanine N-acetyltransferase|nr:GNAT family N-acetyltransferase [Gammaproteobacteria bacterium]